MTVIAVEAVENAVIFIVFNGTSALTEDMMSGILPDMDVRELSGCLTTLGLQQDDAAKLLRVTTRTLRRWSKGDQPVSGPAAELLRAWCRLHKAGLPWAADFESVLAGDDEQIRLHQIHARELDGVLRRVATRRGPAAPWQVDLRGRRATLGPMTVSFYALKNGGFSLANYRRKDVDPDPVRDRQLIEDAVAAIAQAVAIANKQLGPNWADMSE